jgi:hypothetical protein
MSRKSGLSTNKGRVASCLRMCSDIPPEGGRMHGPCYPGTSYPPPTKFTIQPEYWGLLAQAVHEHTVRTIIGRPFCTPDTGINCRGHELVSMNLPSGNHWQSRAVQCCQLLLGVGRRLQRWVAMANQPSPVISIRSQLCIVSEMTILTW